MLEMGDELLLDVGDKKDCPKKRSSSMVWSKAKDLQLLKEVAAEGVLKHKQRSKERGTKWQMVADRISVSVGHDITSRAARDHYNTVTKKYRARMAREERATGEGGEELMENESLLEELIDIEDETERQMENDKITRQKIRRLIKKEDKHWRLGKEQWRGWGKQGKG